MFSLACNLTKDEVEFLPNEILSKKVRANTMDFSIIKLHRKKVSGNNVDFSTIEIAFEKVLGKTWILSMNKIRCLIRWERRSFEQEHLVRALHFHGRKNRYF